MKIFKYIAIVAMLMASATVSAQHMYTNRHIHHSRPVRVVKVVTRPVVVSHTSNKLSKDDRLEMALAYLKNNECLTIRQYHKMTGLSKETAEAELDSFAADTAIGIAMVMDGRKKVYTLS